MSVVEQLRPRAVLVENVPNLPTWDDGSVLLGFFESFRSLGYTVDARVIDCFLFGVPQHRARLFIVATRDTAEFVWPEPRGDFTSLRDAIGDLPMVPGGQRDEELPYRPRRSLTSFQERMRAHAGVATSQVIHDHVTRSVRADDLEAYELLGEGQTYADLPNRLRRYRSDIFTDKYKRLAWGELSRTITAHLAKDGYWYIHPEQHRTLSVREAARLQTFPDDFRFAGQPSHRYRQIGNAVPPMMGETLGKAIAATLRSRRPSSPLQRYEGRARLLAWHESSSRRFPWRAADLEPWHVLMAEMCLHRTRADQVAPVFEALLELAPTPQDMVENAEEALAVMRSLGLRWRAENIVKVAQALIEVFDGIVPETDLELRTLPGVGDYVAQAVLCFGFARRAVLIDTNTVRITSRLYGRDATRRWQLRVDLHRMAGENGPDAEFNYALLDLGALVCTARSPRCSTCPLAEICVTGAGVAPPAQLELGGDLDAA
jgi:DNA (cytosine-5)-methyltransferase 1